MKKTAKIFVAGHKGLVGSAIVRQLKKEGYKNVVTRTRQELDLFQGQKVVDFFKKEKIEYVFDAAAKVGGIWANNKFPADFIYQNLVIQNNIINGAYLVGVKKLLFLGSSCIYPKFADQPIREESLMTGALEETNSAYAIAKIAGVMMCQAYNRQYGTDFISIMPTNLYGQNDNFDLETSHVLPALIHRFHKAKKENSPSVVVWGSGKVKREFLFVDDLAVACVFLMNNYSSSEIINVGTGEDVTIAELAEMIKETVGYKGEIIWDKTKPDGTPRKLLDVVKINKLGWKSKTSLKRGLKETYAWFKANR